MTTNSAHEIEPDIPVILAVDDESSMRDMLTIYLTRMGFKVLSAASGSEALKILSDNKLDLVLTDIVMKPFSGLDLLKRIRRDYPQIAVVAFTGHCSEDVVIDALRSGAVDFLKKPFSLEDLESVVRKALRLKEGRGGGAFHPRFLKSESKVMVLPNDPNLIEGVVEQLTLNAERCISKGRSRELAVALYELILNAMEHGNLEIKREEKTEHLDAGDYLEFMNERRSDPNLARRRVTVEYRLENRCLSYEIRDEGDGFDWRAACEFPRDPVECLAAHGRGVLLAGFYVDEMEFNEKGNVARLTMFTDCEGEKEAG